MQISWTLICLTAAVCVCAASPSPPASPAPPAPLARVRRQLDFFTNTGKLIEELVGKLDGAAVQAQTAVSEFKSGLGEQAARCRQRFQQQLQALQGRARAALDALRQKLLGSGAAVAHCIDSQREAAGAIYPEAGRQFAQCADGRVAEGAALVQQLRALRERAGALGAGALADMRNCTQQGAPAAPVRGPLTVGACLGALALRTEMQAASLLMQSGLEFGRLSLFMGTLPAALEACAGGALAGAGLDAARLLMEVGACSTHALVDNFVGAAAAATPAPAPAANIAAGLTNAAALAANQINNLAAGNI